MSNCGHGSCPSHLGRGVLPPERALRNGADAGGGRLRWVGVAEGGSALLGQTRSDFPLSFWKRKRRRQSETKSTLMY